MLSRRLSPQSACALVPGLLPEPRQEGHQQGEHWVGVGAEVGVGSGWSEGGGGGAGGWVGLPGGGAWRAGGAAQKLGSKGKGLRALTEQQDNAGQQG